jgi:hypothetical protein
MEAVEMAVNQKNRRRNNGSKAGIVNLLIHYVYSLLIIAAARCKTEHTSDRFFLQPALSINGKRFLFYFYHRATTQRGISLEINDWSWLLAVFIRAPSFITRNGRMFFPLIGHSPPPPPPVKHQDEFPKKDLKLLKAHASGYGLAERHAT